MIRLLSIIAALAIAGCAATDRRNLTEFEPLEGDTFRFQAKASAEYPEDTAGGEAVRMNWLETYLSDNGLCPDGYTLTERKPVVTRHSLFGPMYTVFYRGHCADQHSASSR